MSVYLDRVSVQRLKFIAVSSLDEVNKKGDTQLLSLGHRKHSQTGSVEIPKGPD